MAFFNVVLVCLIFLCGSFASEPKCSKFDFEEKTLEKVIRMELTMERLLAENKEVEQRMADTLNTMQQERQTLQEERQAMQQTLEQERQNMQVGQVFFFF